ncbi:MAG TPA: peptidylprolyl isomerase [Dermatophilaceae bacterium]|nr:peptidylprolyl isomerase [Dermatophilaceae bacterium]
MTRQQEHDRARRRWEKRRSALAQRDAQRARTRRLLAVVASVVAVALALWGLGAAFAPDPEPGQVTAAGCALPPAALGTGAQLELPDKATAAGRTYSATLSTNCGDVVLELDGAAAPQAVASFVQLARADYWRNAPCHRLLAAEEATLLQCGDPTGTGQGTPGYGYGVENAPEDGVYPRGTVAMARTSDPAKGNGGQFFLVAQQTRLPDADGYTIFGKVIEGLGIVDKIVAAGVAPGGQSSTDGAPAAPLSILRVAVIEKKA